MLGMLQRTIGKVTGASRWPADAARAARCGERGAGGPRRRTFDSAPHESFPRCRWCQ